MYFVYIPWFLRTLKEEERVNSRSFALQRGGGGRQSRTVAAISITWAYHYNLPDDCKVTTSRQHHVCVCVCAK